jgi:threonine dehydrogenase-like Zn-dependent dehydrogenase
VALGLVRQDCTFIAYEDGEEKLLAHAHGMPIDASLICTTRNGALGALTAAIRVVKDGGCIDLITNFPESSAGPYESFARALRNVRAANVCGLPEDGRYLVENLAGRCLNFTGHRGTSRAHLTRAMQALTLRPDLYSRLITHVLSIEEAASAIETLARSHERRLKGLDCIKAVIDMRCSPYTPLPT